MFTSLKKTLSFKISGTYEIAAKFLERNIEFARSVQFTVSAAAKDGEKKLIL